jgi:hypothetical protein
MSFNQTAAPTGWTKDTSSAINDAVLRLVTGSVSSGGSTGFSSWNSTTATGAYTLATADIPSHTHTAAVVTSSMVNSQFQTGTAGAGDTGATGGGGSHSHSLSNNIKYYDFIIASKN